MEFVLFTEFESPAGMSLTRRGSAPAPGRR
jgi:hypothetical protein